MTSRARGGRDLAAVGGPTEMRRSMRPTPEQTQRQEEHIQRHGRAILDIETDGTYSYAVVNRSKGEKQWTPRRHRLQITHLTEYDSNTSTALQQWYERVMTAFPYARIGHMLQALLHVQHLEVSTEMVGRLRPRATFSEEGGVRAS